jgi:hypothetical protein
MKQMHKVLLLSRMTIPRMEKDILCVSSTQYFFFAFYTVIIVICTTSYEIYTFFHEFAD